MPRLPPPPFPPMRHPWMYETRKKKKKIVVIVGLEFQSVLNLEGFDSTCKKVSLDIHMVTLWDVADFIAPLHPWRHPSPPLLQFNHPYNNTTKPLFPPHPSPPPPPLSPPTMKPNSTASLHQRQTSASDFKTSASQLRPRGNNNNHFQRFNNTKPLPSTSLITIITFKIYHATSS